MAVDTKAKRFSMLNFGCGDLLLPSPDGTITTADRAHLLGLYSGIALSSPILAGMFKVLAFQSLVDGAIASQSLVDGAAISQSRVDSLVSSQSEPG